MPQLRDIAASLSGLLILGIIGLLTAIFDGEPAVVAIAAFVVAGSCYCLVVRFDFFNEVEGTIVSLGVFLAAHMAGITIYRW